MATYISSLVFSFPHLLAVNSCPFPQFVTFHNIYKETKISCNRIYIYTCIIEDVCEVGNTFEAMACSLRILHRIVVEVAYSITSRDQFPSEERLVVVIMTRVYAEQNKICTPPTTAISCLLAA